MTNGAHRAQGGIFMTNFKREYLTRQLDLIPMDKLGQAITIIGAGAVGSHTALSLARMGFGNLTVWDNDTVSDENMNCQGYFADQITRPKVDALAENIERAVGLKIRPVYDRYYAQTLGGIVIMAVDSMEVRKDIWQHCQTADWVVDGRMGAEFAKLFVMSPWKDKDREAYPKTLYSDDEAIHEPCTAKATIYCASLLSGLVVKAVKDIVTSKPYTRIINWNIRSNAVEQHLGGL